jgi:hypothetical protein
MIMRLHLGGEVAEAKEDSRRLLRERIRRKTMQKMWLGSLLRSSVL